MTQTTTEAGNIATVRRFFEVGPSKGDIAAADALLAPEFSLHTPLPTPGPRDRGDEQRYYHLQGCISRSECDHR